MCLCFRVPGLTVCAVCSNAATIGEGTFQGLQDILVKVPSVGAICSSRCTWGFIVVACLTGVTACVCLSVCLSIARWQDRRGRRSICAACSVTDCICRTFSKTFRSGHVERVCVCLSVLLCVWRCEYACLSPVVASVMLLRHEFICVSCLFHWVSAIIRFIWLVYGF